jgi:hypothetical protein
LICLLAAVALTRPTPKSNTETAPGLNLT